MQAATVMIRLQYTLLARCLILLVQLSSIAQLKADTDDYYDESDIEAGMEGNTIYTASIDLLQLTAEETEIRKTILKWIKHQERNIPDIDFDEFKRYIKNDKHFFKKDSSPEEKIKYVHHPINCFKLIKNWYTAMTFLTDNKHVPGLQNLEIKLRETYTLPTLKDMFGASSALIRLQRTYNMTCQQMINGTIKGQKPHQPLTFQDYNDLGIAASLNSDFRLAVDWLHLVIEEAKPGDSLPNVETYKAIAPAYDYMGDFLNALIYTEKLITYIPNDPMLKKDYSDIMHDFLTSGNNKHTYLERFHAKFQPEFEALCRGEVDQKMNATYTKNLFCLYKAGKLPYVVYKEEILSWDPRISQFHEFISQKTIIHIITEAAPKLQVALVARESDETSDSSGYKHNPSVKEIPSMNRISKVAFMKDNEDAVLQQLNLQISDITGLDSHYRVPHSSAENFQVINYGIVGYYLVHLDFYDNEKLRRSWQNAEFVESGDRMASFMLYLTDVEHGGATAFPILNLTIPPIKSSAVFWYNANLSGKYDKRTLHGGCPVLLGQKWVMTKWIREYGQEFRRPCGLRENDVDYS